MSDDPIEEALSDYMRRRPRESAAAFLKRMRALAPPDDAAVAEMEAAIEARSSHIADPGED